MAVSSPTPKPTVVPPEDKKRLIARLSRIEGQLRGVQKMISEDKECEDIAQQIAAARGALDKAFADQITCAVQRRMASYSADTPEARQAVEEILSIFIKYN